jgi:hypothetical protein
VSERRIRHRDARIESSLMRDPGASRPYYRQSPLNSGACITNGRRRYRLKRISTRHYVGAPLVPQRDRLFLGLELGRLRVR